VGGGGGRGSQCTNYGHSIYPRNAVMEYNLRSQSFFGLNYNKPYILHLYIISHYFSV
jgi:hypothetical protein